VRSFKGAGIAHVGVTSRNSRREIKESHGKPKSAQAVTRSMLGIDTSIIYCEIRVASTTPACTVGEPFIEEQLNSISLIRDKSVTTTVSPQQCHNSKFVIFQEKRLKVLKCYNFLSATTTQQPSSGVFCKLRYDTVTC